MGILGMDRERSPQNLRYRKIKRPVVRKDLKKKNLVLILNRKSKSEFGLKKRVEIFLAHNLVNGTLVRFYSMCMSAGLSMCTCTI